MSLKKTLAGHALKHNPFGTEVPVEALLETPALQNFCWRVSHLAREGGFALLGGDSGMGKSAGLRILEDRLGQQRDLVVRVLTRPQAGLSDFYRELGSLFSVPLTPHNRWAGTKQLREQWQEHIESSTLRPVLLVDEAQEMGPLVLNELRLLAAAALDAHCYLTVVLAGDHRLAEKLRLPELIPLGTRIRVRLTLEPSTPQELLELLRHALVQAGNPKLMTPELMDLLVDASASTPRILMTIAGQLLDAAIQKDQRQLDEKLYFEVCAPPPASQDRGRAKPAAAARAR
jgi:type II secretory pathway predicted ATPase ExeA